MDQTAAEDTPIYAQLCKEYDAAEKLNELFGPKVHINYWKGPLHAND
jgi:hypothetical protein